MKRASVRADVAVPTVYFADLFAIFRYLFCTARVRKRLIVSVLKTLILIDNDARPGYIETAEVLWYYVGAQTAETYMDVTSHVGPS